MSRFLNGKRMILEEEIAKIASALSMDKETTDLFYSAVEAAHIQLKLYAVEQLLGPVIDGEITCDHYEGQRHLNQHLMKARADFVKTLLAKRSIKAVTIANVLEISHPAANKKMKGDINFSDEEMRKVLEYCESCEALTDTEWARFDSEITYIPDAYRYKALTEDSLTLKGFVTLLLKSLEKKSVMAVHSN